MKINGSVEKLGRGTHETFDRFLWDSPKGDAPFAYTPIYKHNQGSPLQQSRFAKGYNLFPDAGIESCTNNISCCLTAYNEPFSAYRDTIASLLECAEYIRKKGEDRVSREFMICIIVDGIEKMSSEFVAWAKSLGMYDENALYEDADMHIFESNLPRSRLLSSLHQWDKTEDVTLHSVTDIDSRKSLQRVLLLVKKENQGKLDSHRCFFDTICGLYHSSYFVQIDVGTVPEKSAIYHMWAELQDKPHISAVAARSHLAPPKDKSDLLALWQFCDIALERIVNWPTEIFAGNLSVLPGQLSLTRIASILPERNNERSGILGNYYKGLGKLSLFESNMYLAEDRILGLEMIYEDNNKWDLSYAIDAEAVVDSCETWGELCRQRRRWICSSTACRLAMLGKLPQLFRNSCRNAQEKTHKVVATAYFLIYSLFEWLVPGFHLVAQATVNNLNLAASTNPLAQMFHHSLWIALLAATTAQIGISLNKNWFNRSEKIIRISLGTQIFCLVSGLASLVLFNLNSFHALAVGSILIAMTITYAGIGKQYCKKLAGQLLLTMPQYMLSRLSVKAFLTSYSILNSHNTSWGTKGLETDEESGRLFSQKTLELIKTRLPVVAVFSLSNALLYFGFHASGLLTNISTVYTLMSVISIQLCLAIPAFWHVKRTNKKHIL